MSGFNFDITPQNFDFNAASFGLGLVAGWATAYALYRARHVIGAARQSVTERATTAQAYASRSADARYIRDLKRYCETAHLAGEFVPLSNIVVEPRFVCIPKLASIQADDEGSVTNVFDVVPNVPDYPYLQAPYNTTTLTLEELDNGARHIALLGIPGSGRTTALQTIALWGLGEVNFDPPPDKVQQRLDEENHQLSNKERAERLKENVDVQALVQKGLDDKDPREIQKQLSFRQLTPIYVHMGNIILNTSEYGRRIDPAEPLLRAAQQHVGRVTSMTLASNLYNRLNEGKVLLLIDGFDEVLADEQPSKAHWLKALIDQYRENFVIVAGGVHGYGGLVQAGLTPVYLRPWHDQTIRTMVEKWVTNWSKIAGARRRGAHEPHEAVITQAHMDNRARSAFELTLKTWATLHFEEAMDLEQWLENYLAYMFPNQSLGAVYPKIVQLARLQLDKGYITEGQLAYLIDRSTLLQSPTGETDDGKVLTEIVEDISFLDDTDDAFLDDDFFDNDLETENSHPNLPEKAPSSSSSPKTEESGKQSERDIDKAQQKLEREYAKLIVRLHKSGLLTRYRGNRYQFKHPLIAAYFGAFAMREMSTEALLEIADAPTWQLAFPYAAAHTPIEQLVSAKLNAPSDLLYDNALQLAHWLPYTSEQTYWRNEVITRLGEIFLEKDQYPTVRERAAAALVTTRNSESLTTFDKGFQSNDADVKRLSCLAIGAMRDDSYLNDLSALMEESPDRNVSLSAAIALGAIGTEDALKEMAYTLLNVGERDEFLGRALAETFAADPEEGYELLFEATTRDNMFLRRASVFGLRRINTPWATIAIYNMSARDKQAYVKLAAESVLYDTEYLDSASGVEAYPNALQIPWLRSWILSRGVDELDLQNLPEGKTPGEYLLLAMKEAPDDIKRLAMSNIGQLGLINYAGSLYEWLGDRDRRMRIVAHEALSTMQLHLGRPLPLPA